MLKKRCLVILLVVCMVMSGMIVTTSATVTKNPGSVFYSMAAPASTLDFIDLSSSSFAEKALFTTLQGIVNKTQPRIYVWYNANPAARDEGKYTWLNELGLGYQEVADPYSLITKYKNEVGGIIIYDAAQPATLNLATTIAGLKNAIVADAALATTLQASPYSLPVLVDLRTNHFTSAAQVYQYAYDHYWSQCNHDFIIGLDPDPNSGWGLPYFSGFIRDYAVATKAMCVYLNTSDTAQDTVLRKFLNDMPKGKSAYLGWVWSEGASVSRFSQYGVGLVPADRCENLSVFSGMSRSITPQTVPAAPALQNKIYVTFVLSDGDNLQYCQHNMKAVWDTANHGVVPVNWTISPTAYDLAPQMLNWYLTHASAKECLIAGPTAAMYTYPDQWPSSGDFATFANTSNYYMSASGLRATTVWGFSEPTTRQLFSNIPSLLGVTAQQVWSGGSKVLDGINPISDMYPAYTSSLTAVQNAIDGAVNDWDGTYPKFVSVQYVGWDDANDLNNIISYLNGLDSSIYQVLRADNFFQLMKQANQRVTLPNGTYEIKVKSSGKNVDVSQASTANGAAIVQMARSGSTSQLWNITATDNGYYKLINVKSGKALAINGASTTRGALALQWDYGTAQNDQWAFIRMGDGQYKMVNRLSGWTLDVGNNSMEDNARLSQWNDNGQTNQVFALTKYSTPVNSGWTYRLIPRNSGKCVETAGGSMANNALVQQNTYASQNHQKWMIISTDGIYYKFINANSGKAMAVSGASKTAGAAILQYDFGIELNDQWAFIDAGDGYYKIINRNSGLLLDVKGNVTSDNIPLDQYNDLNQQNQQFAPVAP